HHPAVVARTRSRGSGSDKSLRDLAILVLERRGGVPVVDIGFERGDALLDRGGGRRRLGGRAVRSRGIDPRRAHGGKEGDGKEESSHGFAGLYGCVVGHRFKQRHLLSPPCESAR